MMPIWLPLWQLIELSNGLAILIIVVCLFTMIAFIVRLVFLVVRRLKPDNMDDSSVVHMKHEPQEIQLKYQASPFQIILPERNAQNPQSYESGIYCSIGTTRSYWFGYMWGYDINLLHQTMQWDWKQIKKAMLDGTLFGDVFSRSEPQLVYEKEQQITLKPPDGFSEANLGDPRTRFPLVIVFFINEDDLEGELSQNDTVCLVNVVHIKDSACTMDTKFVFKLTKLANGKVLCYAGPFIQTSLA